MVVLLARAVVESPDIPFLDEPRQGLEPFNRKMILAPLNDICHMSHTQLIVDTHRMTEAPDCTTHKPDVATGVSTTGSFGFGV